jgi:DNA-binding response OmpR family regulator
VASILVSEVEPDVRRLLVVLIERHGHDAAVLRDDVVVPPRAGLLVVDPATAVGVEHARLVRAFSSELPILCLNPLPSNAGFLGRGPTFFLPKPFSPAQFGVMLDRALAPAASAV